MKKLLLFLLFLLYSSLGFSQLVEGFENTPGISGPLPATWTLGSGNWTVFENNFPNATSGTGQSWGINAFATGLQYEGNNCASVSREGILVGNTSEDYLVTPPVPIPVNGQLRFYTRMFTSGDQGTIYRIMIAPAFVSQTDINSYVLVEEWTENNLITPASNYDVWTEKTVDLLAYAGLGIDVYIAFVRVHTQTDANISGDRWLIDNIDVTPPCVISPIANLSSPTTVDLSWNSSNSNPVEVMLLPCDESPPSATDNGIVVNDNVYQFTNLIPDMCYTAYIKSTCNGFSAWRQVIVSFNNPPIRLISFVDENNNSIKDVGETNFSNGYFKINVNNSVSYYASTSSGIFAFVPETATDLFDFNYLIHSFYSDCLTLGTFNYDDIPVTSQSQTFYFPLIQTQTCFDNFVHLTGGIPPRPGITHNDYLSILGRGQNISDSGTLTYTKAPNTTIDVSPSAGIVYTPTGFTYNYSGLATNRVQLTISTSVAAIPTVNLGDILSTNASISFAPGDMNPANDNYSLSRTVVSSYDPNDIHESHGPQIQFDQFSQNDYLTYTIRFQNTGNANAIRVRVDNVLDSRIDETSISMIDARHNYIMVRRDNTVSWEFNNIQLPPASVNEDLSNGFITFRVKLKPGFVIGDIIPATASIYFDSNPAIVTETFNTEFVEQLGNPGFNSGSVSLYPNPAKATVQITQTGNEGIEKVSFFDVTGKLVKRISNIINSQEAIDISTLAKGIYFVEITNTADIKTVKNLIIQ